MGGEPYIYLRHQHILAVKVFKFVKNLNLEFTCPFFIERDQQYSHRYDCALK